MSSGQKIRFKACAGDTNNRGECRAASITRERTNKHQRWGICCSNFPGVLGDNIARSGPVTYYRKRGQIFLPVKPVDDAVIFEKFCAWILDMGEKNVKGYFVVPVCLPIFNVTDSNVSSSFLLEK